MSSDTDMSIPISYLTSDHSPATSSTDTNNGQLDDQGFLQLLIAQLDNQDPSSPTDSTTILTQTSALAQMQTMEEEITTTRESFALQMRGVAAQFVGQQITWTDANGDTQSGVVDSADFSGSVPQLHVGDSTVALDAVLTLAPTAD